MLGDEEFVGEVPPLDGSESTSTQRSDSKPRYCLFEIGCIHSNLILFTRVAIFETLPLTY
jgi:hypothetical protein